MKHLKRFALILPLACGVASCSNEVENIKPVSSENLTASLDLNVVSHPLNWEGIDYMPHPTNKGIRVPWESANCRIPSDIVYDYKSADGWQLLYNTFSDTQAEEHLYFILYNKYRGVARLYYYTVASHNNTSPSSNIIHSLGFRNIASSHLLQFADQDVVDVNVPSPQVSVVEKWQYSVGAWYAFQVEFAYDPNLNSSNFRSYEMLWHVNAINISQFAANGKSEGDIKGQISVSPSSVNITTNPTITTTNNSGVIINGKGDIDGDAKNGGKGIGDIITAAVKDGLKKGITNGLAGLASNVLSGIFSKKTDNSENVSMKLKTNISMTGTLTSNSAINNFPIRFRFPDYSNTYTASPGVFYISKKPTIKEEIRYHEQRDMYGNLIPGWYQTDYSYVPDFNLVFNPEVLSAATIRDIKYEVVIGGGVQKIAGNEELIGENAYYTGHTVAVKSRGTVVTGVRVSFKVVPNDGTPPVFIVRTFKANVSSSESTVPAPPGGGGGQEDS